MTMVIGKGSDPNAPKVYLVQLLTTGSTPLYILGVYASQASADARAKLEQAAQTSPDAKVMVWPWDVSP